jgi:hypothetical protein
MDKKGRSRPEGYKMEIEPREVAVVLRIFKAFADGLSLTRIVCMLNEEEVPGRVRSAKGWSPARLYAHIPEIVRVKETELVAEERRLANFVDFIGEGRGSQALGRSPKH